VRRIGVRVSRRVVSGAAVLVTGGMLFSMAGSFRIWFEVRLSWPVVQCSKMWGSYALSA